MEHDYIKRKSVECAILDVAGFLKQIFLSAAFDSQISRFYPGYQAELGEKCGGENEEESAYFN